MKTIRKRSVFTPEFVLLICGLFFRERVEKEKALALQRELERAAREKERRELEEKKKALEEKKRLVRNRNL